MKKNIYKIGLILVILSIVGAGVASASINLADTSDYDQNLGKVLIFYTDGAKIKNINVTLRNLENESVIYTDYITYDTPKQFQPFIINESMFGNYTYMIYEIVVIADDNTSCWFSGYFSTIILIDYHKIENTVEEIVNDSNAALKSDIMMWMLNNSSYIKHFSGLEANIEETMSTYIDGVVATLRLVGYSDTQIDEMKEVIAAGYLSTLRTEKEQRLEIAQAEQRGWWSGVQLVAIFIVVIIAIVGAWVFVKGKFRLPFVGRIKRIVETTGDSDIFGTG